MKKWLFIYSCLLIFPISSFSQSLLFTQYYEGASNNKWVEIKNIGTDTIDLSNYFLCLFSNPTVTPVGVSPNYKNQLTGNLLPQEVKLYKRSSAVSPTYASGTSASSCGFNGNDILVLTTTNDTSAWRNRVDVLGQPGNWGANISLQRKTSVLKSNIFFDVNEWTAYSFSAVDLAVSDSSYFLGNHYQDLEYNQTGWVNGLSPDTNSVNQHIHIKSDSAFIDKSIFSKSLSVDSNAVLSFFGNLTLWVKDSLVNNGTILFDADSLQPNFFGDISKKSNGQITWKFTLQNQGWHTLTSPFENTVLADFSNSFQIIYTGTSTNVFTWDNQSSEWKIPGGSQDTVSGNSFLFNIENKHLNPNSGVNQNGQFPIKISLSGKYFGLKKQGQTIRYNSGNSNTNYDQGNPIDGWLLIHNPFPFSLSWLAIKNQLNFSGNWDNSYYVYSAKNQQYISHDGQIGHPDLNGFIPPFHSFFVRLTNSSLNGQNNTALNFSKNLHAPHSIYGRSYKKTINPITLSLDGPVSSDFIFLGNNPGSTSQFDEKTDSRKAPESNTESVLFFGDITQNNPPVGINYADYNNPYLLFPLSIKCKSTGVHEIKISESDDYPFVYFYFKSGWMPLPDYQYEWFSPKNKQYQTKLLFSKYAVNPQTLLMSGFNFIQNGHSISYTLSDHYEGESLIQLIDISGKTIYSKSHLTQIQNEISFPSHLGGLFILRIITSQKTYVEKIHF